MKFYARKKRFPVIIIVSLIDIFAILLMFFIVTTTFKSKQSELSINLPESKQSTERANPANPLVISVTKEEKILLEDQEIASPEELTMAIKNRIDPNRPLVLNAAKEISFGFFLKLTDALKDAGIKNLPALARTPDDAK